MICPLTGWLRASVNDLFGMFQHITTEAEKAAVLCAISAAVTLLGLVFTGCFASRLQRKSVKIYVGN